MPSDLDHALLGLLAGTPRSGYELRKVFQTTPLGSYSDSPGSIYPALRRLEASGHLQGREAEDGRGRRTLRLTPKGRRALVAWMTEPIGEAHLARGTAGVDLRIAFASDIAPRRLRPLLREYRAALLAQLESVGAAQAELEPSLSPSARCALDLGTHVLRERARWCERTLARMAA